MSERKVSWGKIIAGATIAAGAVAAIAFTPEDVLASIGSAIRSVGGAIGNVGSWIVDRVADVVKFIAGNPVIAISSAAVAGGLFGARHNKMDDEAHALKEEIRRMETLMLERMKAQGYQQALAAAGKSR